MDGYIAKPIRAEDLAAAIKQVLAGETTECAIDRTVLLGNLDGDQELLRQLVQTFTADSPKQMTNMRTAIERRDAEGLRLAAHSLKGSVGNFVAMGAFELAQKLENAGRQGDFVMAAGLFNELEAELTRVNEELHRLVHSDPKRISKPAV
jgi:HPt (histidine-containing phosphotransfer) domain-containing protein